MEERLNFGEISALVVDGDRYSSGIVCQILRGFGLKRYQLVDTVEDAKKYLAISTFDLLITECTLPDMQGDEFVRWMRRQSKDSLRHMPIVLLTGYTHYSNVTAARDSGVNSVVRKPVSPLTLYDHIAWSARTERPFIEAEEYSGPCRRFRYGEAAPGLNRRASDRIPEPVFNRPAGAQQKDEEEASS